MVGVFTHYQALGVAEDATPIQIRSAWRDAARRWHPDHAGVGAEAVDSFRCASSAWAVLGDTELRAEYDRELHAAREPACLVCGGRPLPGQTFCSLHALSGATPARPKRPVRPAPSTRPPLKPRAPSKPPIDPNGRWQDAVRDAAAQAVIDKTKIYDDITHVEAPSGDSLLAALLADAALRSGVGVKGKKKRKMPSKLKVDVAPGFTVSIEGEAAETLGVVNSNLRLASRLLKGVSRFFGS